MVYTITNGRKVFDYAILRHLDFVGIILIFRTLGGFLDILRNEVRWSELGRWCLFNTRASFRHGYHEAENEKDMYLFTVTQSFLALMPQVYVNSNTRCLSPNRHFSRKKLP